VTTATQPWTAWKVLLAALLLFSVVIDVWEVANWRRALDPAVAGTLGVLLGPLGADRFQPILSFTTADPPLARAGAKVGDRVSFDHFADFSSVPGGGRALGTDETIGLRLISQGATRHLAVQPVAVGLSRPINEVFSWFLGNMSRWIGLGLAAIVGWRRADSLGMRALALMMLGYNAMGMYFMPGGVLVDHFRLYGVAAAHLMIGLGGLCLWVNAVLVLNRTGGGSTA